MPSFDIVSEVDLNEVRNAVDQSNREVGTRFDFKGTDARFEQSEGEVILSAPNEFQLRQMLDILQTKLVKRGVDIGCLEIKEPVVNLNAARQTVIMRQGIDADLARKLVKQIKGMKLKVQSAVQGEQVRVTGKKRDDLQAVISALGEGDFGLPLQFSNFRD